MTLEIADRRIVSEHRRLLQCFSLPTHLADLDLVSRPPTQYLEEAIYNDKKRISDGLRLVLCKEIGAPRIIVLAQPEILEDAFSVVTQ